MSVVLVTGAIGFIGRHTCAAFRAAGHRVIAGVRLPADGARVRDADEVVVTGDLADTSTLSVAHHVQCVVHLAARAHRMSDRGSTDVWEAYRRANRDSTRALAVAARNAGVQRFVYVSSVKVMGEERDAPYRETDPPAPVEPYAVSKLEAEQALREVAGSMEYVVVRPPMVYGPGGKGNVPRLLRLARLATRLPLPLGAVKNRRSMIYVGNLADVLVRCAMEPHAKGETFLVSDGEDLSTPELLRRVAAAMNRGVRLVAVPPAVLRALARMIGRGAEAARLLDSLAVDTRRVEDRLRWQRPYTVDQGLRETVGARS